jgi:hypothetical protein
MTIARSGRSPHVVDGGAGWQERPAWSTGSRRDGQQVGTARDRNRPAATGCDDGRCIGSPGRCRGPLRNPHIMFRLRCRSIRRERLNSGAARSVKGAASFSSASKRKQRRSSVSRRRVIQRRRRVPPWQSVEASFNVWSAPAPRQGRAGVLHSGFPNSFPEIFPTTDPVRASADARAFTCRADVSRRARADVQHRHAKRLQGRSNATSMFLALARPCSRARAVDVVSVRARMRSSTLIRR